MSHYLSSPISVTSSTITRSRHPGNGTFLKSSNRCTSFRDLLGTCQAGVLVCKAVSSGRTFMDNSQLPGWFHRSVMQAESLVLQSHPGRGATAHQGWGVVVLIPLCYGDSCHPASPPPGLFLADAGMSITLSNTGTLFCLILKRQRAENVCNCEKYTNYFNTVKY